MNKEFNHQTEVQIRFNDVDLMGHVNNAVHQYYFDYARMQYFSKVLGEVNWDKEALVLVNITVDYSSPILLEDKIQIHTRIDHIGEKSVKMTQICLDDKGVVKSSNKAILVGFSKEQNDSIRIPENWRLKIDRLENKEKELSLN